MSKRAKVVVAVLAVILLVAVVTATNAMAQEEPAPTPTPQAGVNGSLLTTVAKILGIPQEKLADAFEQARQEMREECQATGNGTIRQEKVNQFREQRTQKWQEQAGERQETGRGFRGNRTDNQPKMRGSIAKPEPGQQTSAIPESWNTQVLY